MPDLILRQAHYSELPRVADILTRAFWDEPLFGALIHPHRNEHPGGMQLYWLRRARVSYWDYTWRFIVAVSVDSRGTETIVGIAEWARLGKGARKMQCYWFDPRNLLKPLSTAAMRLHAKIWPNHACDPAKDDLYERAAPFLESAWTGDRAESWCLEFLAVDPDWHGKGVGKRLVQWGLETAQTDKVCASVISAAGKEAFYLKAGFDFVDGSAGTAGGEGNPLADVPGGTMLWWMPK